MLSQQVSREASPPEEAGVAVAERFTVPDFPAPAPATRPLDAPAEEPVFDGPPNESPARMGLQTETPPRQHVAPPYGPPQMRPAPFQPGRGYGPPATPPKRRGVPWYGWLIGAILAGVLVLSLFVALAFGVLIGIVKVVNGPQATTSSISTFSVTDIPHIVVNTNAGSVTVVSGPSKQVTVEVTKRARDLSQNAAQNDLNHFNITLTQNGNTVNAISTGDWHTSVSQEFTADLLITVPSASNLDLTLRAGTMTVNDITGALTATVDAGTLITRNVTLNSASRINVITGQATVDAALTNSASLDVTVTTGTASLTLPRDTTAHLDARVTVGDISVSGWSLSVTNQGTEATTSGDLNANPTSAITVRVTTGTIRLSSR